MAAKVTCPHCNKWQEVDPNIPVDDQECIHCGKPLVETAIAERPARRRIRRDEEDDDWEADYPAGVPGTVIVAGIIWIAFGCLSVLGAIYQLIVAAGIQGGAPVFAAAPFCAIVFGGVFILVGTQSIRGTARDVLGNGIGSLIFGALYTVFGVVLLFTREHSNQPIAVFVLFFAVVLYVAGVLALVARSEYRTFRRATQRPRRRRRSAE